MQLCCIADRELECKDRARFLRHLRCPETYILISADQEFPTNYFTPKKLPQLFQRETLIQNVTVKTIFRLLVCGFWGFFPRKYLHIAKEPTLYSRIQSPDLLDSDQRV